MTYDSRERSADQARPVELYEFRREAFIWRYTTADRDYVQDFQTFQRAAIRRGTIEQGSEMNRSALRLTLDPALDIVEQYRTGPTTDAVSLTLRQVHEGDGQAAVIWTGRITSVSPWKNGQAEIVLEPVYTSLRRNGLRRIYQRQCPHVLYGAACGVNPAAFRVTGTVGGIAGTVVTVGAAATFPVGYFDGGMLEWEVAPATFERRFILAHSSASLTLSTQPQGLQFGAEVRAYPGCDHSTAACGQKFGNLPNYGGMPYIPQKNPYGSDPIY